MRFTSTIPPLLLSLPLLAIAAPNASGESAPTSTETSTETKTIKHTQMLTTLTATYPASTSLSYFPLIAATQPVSGPLPDIPNPTSTVYPDISPVGSVVVTQILVAVSTTSKSTKSSHKSSSSVSVGFSIGTGASSPGTVTTPLVIASATNPITPSVPIASFPGAAPGRIIGCGVWSSGMVLLTVAVGYAAGLL